VSDCPGLLSACSLPYSMDDVCRSAGVAAAAVSAGDALPRQPPATTQRVIPTSDLLAGSLRLRSRAPRRLATGRPFSYSMKAPATWRIILRPRSSLSVRSSPRGGQEPNALLSQQRNAQLLQDQVSGKAAGVLDG
jgi:hypothetical protein